MPRRNRVTPFGEIVAEPERGTMMGNRGILHDSSGVILRTWQVKRWLICVLEFRGRHRTVMAPNRYTELFFLDEATALSAGHRPCAECRRGRFLAFRNAWAAGNLPAADPSKLRASVMDERLHAERIGPKRTKRTFRANIDDLPDGVFISMDGDQTVACLISGNELLAWTPTGYRERRARPAAGEVSILTPESTVAQSGRATYPRFIPRRECREVPGSPAGDANRESPADGSPSPGRANS